MLKYTREGIEYEEKKLAQQEALRASAPDGEEDGENNNNNSNSESNIISPVYEQEGEELVEPNAEDYEYELQGVLVHSGVAQGGHYFSFAKDPLTADK